MATKRRGLGRGLEALIGAPEGALQRLENASSEQLRKLPIESINRGSFQPRTHFEPEALEELAASIRTQGVLQPIVVRTMGDEYELIAGERRWRAAQLAGLQEIPAVVRDLDDTAAAAIALIENIQRENLNALELANGLQRLINEFGLTHQQVAEAVGRSRASVTNLLRLLELAEEVKGFLDRGELEMGHARALLSLKPAQQIQIARRIAQQGLSVREAEALARKALSPTETRSASSKQQDPNVNRLEQELAEKLGAKVQIQHSSKGQGKLVIHYKSCDELEGMLRRFR
ncbi:MAG: ParB/RepB/Spo0J family partition protein [Gammaproteobacteria bacterium]|nr:ParB/RepB/Spo0J family partition protein [Gammaproteobacteria bacterium]